MDTASPNRQIRAGRSLRITFLYGHLRFSGGRKVLRDYADDLRSGGHQVCEIARQTGRVEDFGYDVESVLQTDRIDRTTVPESDLIVVSEHDEVRDAVATGRGPVVHFCQGFQIHDYEHRLRYSLLPERYQSAWWGLRRLELWKQRRKWRRRIREFDAIYSLPTRLVCVSRELSKHLQQRYGRPVELAENGISPDHFRPAANPPAWKFDRHHPCRILSVGSSGTLFKGIGETVAAVSQVKSKGLPVEFIRISPEAPSNAERLSGVVDEFHHGLSQSQMADLYRSCHLYVSNSHPGEGFGLPAMEALRSGLATVLSEIPAYRSFADHRRFTRFVPVCDPSATANAIEDLMAWDPEAIGLLRREAKIAAERFTLENARRGFEAALLRIAEQTPEQEAQAA